ncbi:hypothetical protein [Rhodoligotrophos defluvii]|uniref:hypothetical protein n=1 Tax=Rhodoligotrophos defluvii TaxID=2561934 RepID=UPI0010C9730D|nr:hypothetical protein [Rhodoligotrophos defluvii]
MLKATDVIKQLVRAIPGLGLIGTRPAQEVIYQNLFMRDLENIGIRDEFYPVGYAANYSLMYLILRIYRENAVKRVVELGAGQSTLLLDALSNALYEANIITIEHDRSWAEKMRTLVRHKVYCAPLKRFSDKIGTYTGYDFSSIDFPDQIDFLLIDGPISGPSELKFSRHGAMEIIDRLDSEGFAIVIDDAERMGEAILARRVCDHLSSRGVKFHVRHVYSSKKQIVIASGRMSSVAFY